MKGPPFPKPVNEDYRLVVLEDIGILDSGSAPEFDRLTRLAARHFDVMIALVSIVGEHRQWFKSCFGLDASETDRRHAFCSHTILGADIMVVPDATRDGRFKDNPLVTGPPNIRFYAGAPLIIDGAAIGTFCLVDDTPRSEFTDEDKACLSAFAQIAIDEIRLADLSRIARNPYVEKLRRAQRRTDAAEEAKTQFLAMMSHELRTPLNAVIGFAEAISGEILGPVSPPQYRDFARHIVEGGRRQLRLIERMLQLTDQGKIELQEETIDLKALVHHCTDSLAGEALLARIVLREDLPKEPLCLCADPVHMEQIVLELISNAMKATPRGEHIRIAASVDDSRAITVSIVDNGCGISELDFPEAVDVFSQVSKGYDRKTEGAGIGLPIVRKLAELHGATLSLTPRAECGTCASVCFPAYRTVAVGAPVTMAG
jgi:signal transduction histidine kinase